MATASNTPPTHAPTPRNRHSPKESQARGVPSVSDSSSPSSFSGISDQEQFMASDFEVISPPAATACFLAEDTQPEGSENGGVTKKHVWNKPANGVTSEVGAVMGTDSWPALSKSARASPDEASSTDSLKAHSCGSLTLSQGMSVGSSSSQEEVIDTIVSATNSTWNHGSRSRQRSMEQCGDSLSHSNITANGSLCQAQKKHSSVVEASKVKSSNSTGESPKDNTQRDVEQRGGSYNGNVPHQPHGPFRRNNSGPQPQGNVSFPHSHGGKRDQERGKQEWSNTNRSFGSRVNLATQQRVASRPFIRCPISNAPFISPQPSPVAARPYGTPVFYNDMSSFMYYVPGHHQDSLRHIPMVPFAPTFYHIPDPQLPSKIVSQMDYYFSDENLVKDTFLRQKMDVDGWVPINFIATFMKMRELTDNIQLIVDAVRASHVVEVQGEKVRQKGNWKKWILPPIMFPTGTIPLSLSNSSQDILTACINNVILDEKEAT